jgi:hypothetical protein
MKKEMTIIAPDGYVIDEEAFSNNQIKFNKIPEVKALPKTWLALQYIKGYYIDTQSSIMSTQKVIKYATPQNKNVIPTKELAEAMLALCQLLQLREVYNDGWQPDWANEDQHKYVISTQQNVITTMVFYNYNAILAFKTEELQREFLENFKSLIEIAKPLL